MKISVIFNKDLRFLQVVDENNKELQPHEYGGRIEFNYPLDGQGVTAMHLNVDPTEFV